jgi:phage terminase large subunit-like protein
VSDPMALMGALKLEDGRPWGQVAEPWQVEDARQVLGGIGPAWLSRPKGASKSTDVAAMTICWLLTLARPLDDGYLVAADQEQAGRLVDRARGLVVRSGLTDLLEVQQGRIVHRESAAKVTVLAADAPGAEGILASWIVCDELPNWADTPSAKKMWAAVFSSVAKRACRLTVIGHAGRPGSWQHVLFERAQASDGWLFSHLDGPTPWLAAAALAEQEATLLPHEWERRFRNVWSAGEEALVAGGCACVCP